MCTKVDLAVRQVPRGQRGRLGLGLRLVTSCWNTRLTDRGRAPSPTLSGLSEIIILINKLDQGKHSKH